MGLAWKQISHGRGATPWIFLLPFIIGLLVFVLIPLLASVGLIFFQYDVLSDPVFVGLANLQRMLHSETFWDAWRITILYTAGSVAFGTALAFIIALGLYHVGRAAVVWKTIYYLPALLTGTAQALILEFTWSKAGLINSALTVLGLDGPGWLQDSNWALLTLILASYWTIGNAVLFFLGSRAAVPKELYEVAAIDGASRLSTLRYITIPMMTPIILFNLVLGFVFGLQSFTQIFILTRGGPAGATRTIGILIYEKAFRDLEFGYASALSWTLFLVTFVVAVLLLLSSRSWVYYETGNEGL